MPGADRSPTRALIDHLRDLHSTYAEERPDAAVRRAEIMRGEKEQADQRARNALTRQQAIREERAQFRARLRDLGDAISRQKMAKQAIEQFARRYAEVAAMAARIPVADAERQREEEAARTARAAAAKARSAVDQNRVDAVRLGAAAEARRSEKAHYPETDGGAADRIATLEDARSVQNPRADTCE